MAAVAPAQESGKERLPDLKTSDYTLAADVFVDNVKSPWSIAFIDGKQALVTEKSGPVRMVIDGKLQPEPVRGTPTVNPGGQGGMMDVAIDPDYADNGWIYLSYSHSPGEETKGPAMTRIVRGKIADNAWTEQQVLWEAKPEHYRSGGVHFGCRIVFDKAGHLYFAMGDRGAQKMAQDITLPNGKVHRINRDGSIPSDNPFVGKSDAYESIFSYGNRNPQGMAIDPMTDKLWATEHGPLGGDELNLIESGNNYGWPVITYGKNYSGTPITDITEKQGMEQPVVNWTPSPAMCGLDFVTGDLLPKWNNNLLAGALKFQEVKRLVLEGDKVVTEEVIVKDMGRVRDVVVGPDGAIYVVLNGPDRVVRLSPK
jgi:glucose/arabinose dehydrogenase